MNTEMLIKVRDAIMAKPEENFAMNTWIKDLKNGNPKWEEDGKIASCGTSMCIAGWAIYMSDSQASLRNVLMGVWDYDYDLQPEQQGAKLLGISADEAKELFYRGRWPRRWGGCCGDDLYDDELQCEECEQGHPEDCEEAEMSERDGALAILEFMINNDRMPW